MNKIKSRNMRFGAAHQRMMSTPYGIDALRELSHRNATVRRHEPHEFSMR